MDNQCTLCCLGAQEVKPALETTYALRRGPGAVLTLEGWRPADGDYHLGGMLGVTSGGMTVPGRASQRMSLGRMRVTGALLIYKTPVLTQLFSSPAPDTYALLVPDYSPASGNFPLRAGQYLNYQPPPVLAWRFQPPRLIAIAEQPGSAYASSFNIGPEPAEPHLWLIDVDLKLGGSVTAVNLPGPEGVRHTSKHNLKDGGWYEVETSRHTRVSRTETGFQIEVMLQYVRASEEIGVEGLPTYYYHRDYHGTLTLTRAGVDNWSSQTQEASPLLATWNPNPGTTNADYWDPITNVPNNPSQREQYVLEPGAQAQTPAAFMRVNLTPDGTPGLINWTAVPGTTGVQLQGIPPAGDRWHVTVDPQLLNVTPLLKPRVTVGGVIGTLSPTIGGGVAEFPEPVALTAGNLTIETPTPDVAGNGVQGWTTEMRRRYPTELAWWENYGYGWQATARPPQDMQLVQPISVEVMRDDSQWVSEALTSDWRRVAELAAAPFEPNPGGLLRGVRFAFPARSDPHLWHVAWSASGQGQPIATITDMDSGQQVYELGWNATNAWSPRPPITVEIMLGGGQNLGIASVVEGEFN